MLLKGELFEKGRCWAAHSKAAAVSRKEYLLKYNWFNSFEGGGGILSIIPHESFYSSHPSLYSHPKTWLDSLLQSYWTFPVFELRTFQSDGCVQVKFSVQTKLFQIKMRCWLCFQSFLWVGSDILGHFAPHARGHSWSPAFFLLHVRFLIFYSLFETKRWVIHMNIIKPFDEVCAIKRLVWESKQALIGLDTNYFLVTFKKWLS